ncbi:type 2 lanthipeptide synthetase LanM [Amorphus sp. 3PC139-8]|uniref:type 2 lanthipeptide synthetase LanM n=1 Tax=Amorphus sp. 3PC139-8 TaxID=2735676 RepID=UPI00345CDFC7
MRRDDFLGRLGARSATLPDRLTAARPDPVQTAEAVSIADRRLDRWRRHLNRFDPEGFARRLRLSGIDFSDTELRDRLAPWRPNEDQTPPLDWMIDAWRLADAMACPPATRLHTDDPIPFEDLFSGLAAEECAQLWSDAPETALFSAPARNALARGLIAALSNALASCLEYEFALFRQHQGADRRPDSRAHYDAFLDILREGQTAPLLVKYAEATRRTSLGRAQWRQQARALVQRFAEDRSAIAETFGWATESLIVEALDFGLSDRHHGGAQVHRLHFSGGRTLYYKPRPLGLEAAIGTLTEELGPTGSAILPTMLDRATHGWSNGIAAEAPDLSTYYQAAGRTLALAWVFGASDLHDENVIATAAGPKVVDAETFATPLPRAFAPSPVQALAMAEYDTVLRPGLLPRWTSYADGHPVQISGLAPGGDRASGVTANRFIDINTDAMTVEAREIVITRASDNVLPDHDPAAYADAVLAGFRAACGGFRWSSVQDGRRRVREALAGRTTRVLVRDTHAYAGLLERLRQPQFALTTLDTDIEIESLAASFVATEDATTLWPLYLHEREQLGRGDVPTFSVDVGATRWRARDGSEVALFSRSGLDLIDETIAALDEDTIAIQDALIRTVFHRIRDTGPPEPGVKPMRLTRDVAISEAGRIGDLLLKMASRHQSDDGRETLSWFAPRLSSADGQARIKTLPIDLYDGQAGIGLFLAALSRVSGKDRYANAARAALQPVQRINHHGMGDGRRGGCVGPASLAYALRQAGHLLGDQELQDAACDWAAIAALAHVTPDPDWIDGRAGEAVALLPFRTRLPNGWTQAVLDRLATAAPPKAGAGHGLAGILHAFHRFSGTPPADMNTRLGCHWSADTRDWSHEPAATGWSNGTEGIVLMLHETGLAPDDIATALDRLAAAPECDFDTLSAGTAARIEMWRTVGDPERAREAAAALCMRAVREGRFRVPGGGVPLPGLFDGLAGIGYTLLRLDHAELVPSVLLLEDFDAAL